MFLRGSPSARRAIDMDGGAKAAVSVIAVAVLVVAGLWFIEGHLPERDEAPDGMYSCTVVFHIVNTDPFSGAVYTVSVDGEVMDSFEVGLFSYHTWTHVHTWPQEDGRTVGIVVDFQRQSLLGNPSSDTRLYELEAGKKLTFSV